jgi:cell division protein FtsI/penicillin-binding protein 2
VVPHLLADYEVAPHDHTPLTDTEGEQLRTMLRGVVTDGSGAQLADVPGPPVIAKTGTAEYGNDDPLKTHAWMIAAQGDLAVAVFVNDGKSGSSTAGPLLRKFLAKAR